MTVATQCRGGMPCCELEERLEWRPPGSLEESSQVAAFYDGASVFLTGATGLVGSLILEKLLRSCPGVSTLYVLVRKKKGVPSRERLHSHLEKVVFSKARQACPDYLRKVVAIAGDCAQPGLGISAADAAELCSKVSVVFHVAANERFDADIQTAVSTNVASTCEVIALSRRMPNLKSFVYMSTAYSNAPRLDIDEKFYPTPLKAEELLKLVSVMDDEQLAQLLPMLLGDWPNIYTFTKAVAEDALRIGAAGLPVTIIRPSIVTVTFGEPVSLWAGTMYGPSAIAVGGAVGLLHVRRVRGRPVVDAVPADMVASAAIACAWDTWCRHSIRTSTLQTPPEPVIYNCVSSTRHPITCGSVRLQAERSLDNPNMRKIWISFTLRLQEKYWYVIAAVFVHLIPAAVADRFLRFRGMTSILWDIHSRIQEVLRVLEPFISRQWRFKDDNLVSLLGRLNAADRKLFPFDVTQLDWECHLSNAWRRLRLYLLDDSLGNMEDISKNYSSVFALHYRLFAAGSVPLLYLLWRTGTAVIGLGCYVAVQLLQYAQEFLQARHFYPTPAS